ncbi:MAG: TetR/AcrR family transcriptional regulator [Bacteroidia bacterium]|nr:TetR/AcrR family transcriptional regulator [Bacteroidia bacterium]
MLGSKPLEELKALSPRKQEILEVAQRLISKDGFDGASMRHIAEELGIKTASLYSHYNSKDDMLWEIAIRCAKEFHEHVLPLESMPLSVEDRLGKMVRMHAELVIRNINAAAIFFHEWKHLEEGKENRKAYYKSQIERYEQAFISVIEEGIEGGSFRQVPARFITYTLLNSINWIKNWYKPSGKMKVRNIADEFEAFVLNGLILNNK